MATTRVSSTIGVGSGPVGVAFSPNGAKAYITSANGNGSVSVIDVPSGTVRNTITVGSNPCGVAFSPDGTQAYITNVNSNSVSVIVVATGVVSSTIAVGSFPVGVAFSPAGTQAYVINSNSYGDHGSVSVIATGLPPLLRSMTVSPSRASVQAGTAVTFMAEGYRSALQNNRTDIGSVFPVYTTDSNGVVSGSKVTFTKSGSHTITAKLRGVTASTTVTVTPAALASIRISPTTATLKSGDSLTFTTTGFDRFGNTRGAVTGDSVFTSDNRTDLVKGNTVQFGIPDKRTVTGTDGTFTATSVVTVPVGPPTLPLPVQPTARQNE